MDRVGLFKWSCQVAIWRLLYAIGMIVVAAVVFQCYLLSHGKGNMDLMIVNNFTVLDDVKFTKFFTQNTVGNDSYASGLEEEDLFRRYKDQNSHEEITRNETIIERTRSTNNSSTHFKAFGIKYEHSEKGRESIKRNETLSGYEHFVSNSRAFDALVTSSTSSERNAKQTRNTHNNQSQTVVVDLNVNSMRPSLSLFKRWNAQPISISQMNSIYLQGLHSPHSPKPKWSSARDRELLSAKREIESAPVLKSSQGLHTSIFRNISMFKRSYELMERILRVYIYKEGEKPIFHQPKMRGIYASEGWFMRLIEGNKNFVVRDPKKAHLFYMPISLQMLRVALGKTLHNHTDLQKYMGKYVDLIARKYKFWNRTGGADHMVVACHDWAPKLTKYMKNSIRVLCNANAAKDFKIGKDTTLPVTYIRSMETPLEYLGGNPPTKRPILAFFAGSMHGYLRPILLQHWQNKETDMKILGPMPRDVEGKRSYREHMKSSKYCICARGYEVHTPRVVEAIFHECVPVIISDNYVPPFFEVLNWEAFSVFVMEKDIPNLRNILLSISDEKYLVMQSRVKMVQQHFLWHKKPVKYDLFHMILHSVWLNRVFQFKTRS